MKENHPQTGNINAKGNELLMSISKKEIEPKKFLEKRTEQMIRSKNTSMEDLGLDQVMPV